MSSNKRNQEKNKSELIKNKVQALELAKAKKMVLENMRSVQTSIIAKEYGTDAIWAEQVEKSINATQARSKSKSKSKSKSNVMKSKVIEGSTQVEGKEVEVKKEAAEEGVKREAEEMEQVKEEKEQVKEVAREEVQTMNLAALMDKGKKNFGLVQAGPLIVKPCVPKSGLSPSLRALSRCAKELGNNQIIIPVKKEVMNQIQDLYFGQDEIVRLLEKGELDATHISTYIRLLYEDCLENGLTKTFGFLCPSLTSSSIVSGDAKVIRIKSEQQSEYILNAFHGASDGKIYLAPFNIGHHWILCLINPSECIVYYLDPLRDQGRGIEQNLCNVVDTALRLYWKQPEKSTTWKQIQCPQQDNNFDCGYYVLRFMREIIDHQKIQIPEKYFDDCAFPAYDQGQINEVREELACHALRFYVES